MFLLDRQILIYVLSSIYATNMFALNFSYSMYKNKSHRKGNNSIVLNGILHLLMIKLKDNVTRVFILSG